MTRCAPPPGEGVQVERHRRHQGLAFTGGHFGGLPLVERDRPDQLDIVGDHVPDQVVAGHPHRGSDEPPARLLDDGKGLGKDVVESLLECGEVVLVEFGDPEAEALPLGRILGPALAFTKGLRLVENGTHPVPDTRTELVGLAAQLIPRNRRQPLVDLVDLVDHGLELPRFPGVPISEYLPGECLDHRSVQRVPRVVAWRRPAAAPPEATPPAAMYVRSVCRYSPSCSTMARTGSDTR